MRLGPYQLGERLGAGGMGVVHRAHDERLHRDVAVKLLPERNPDKLRRFVTEAKAAAALSHPNILAVYDVSIEDEQPYLVTELLEGKTLAELLVDGPLGPKKALAYATQIARGLAAAHERNIVHRDLKPSNLFVTKGGVVKILDFGLAKVVAPADGAGSTETAHTSEGAVLGTVGYMAPEQVRGRPADARSDLFAFGCVLAEMLSGRRAFDGPTPVETSYKILRDEPAPLPDGVPAPLQRIVERLLQKEPAERFQSARDLAFALEAVDGGSQPQRIIGAAKRRSGWRWTAAALAVAAGVGAAVWLAPRLKAPTPPRFLRITYRTGAVTNARFAHEGRTVIYGTTEDDKMRVYASEPGNAEARPLTAEGATLADVSSKGEMALLLSNAMVHPGTLARAPIAGGAPRPILDNVTQAAWSPNGEDLMVVHVVDGKRRLEYPIGHVLLETDAARLMARLSPDGQHIAIIEHRVPSYNTARVEVLDLDGKRRALTPMYPAVNSLVWSPDGKEIWFGGGVSRLWANALRAVDLDGHERDLARFPAQVSLRDTTPDGRVLLSAEGFHHRVAGLLSGGDHERDLSWFDGCDEPVLSPDGKRLLTTVLDDPATQGNVAYLREGDSAVPLGGGNALALSPDGAWALVGKALYTELELQPTGAGEPRKLSRGSIELVTRAFFFPDGKRLLLVGRERGKKLRVWISDLHGDPRPISDEGVLTSCAPSPDGALVAAYEDEHAFLLPVDGGAIDPLAKLAKEELPIAWSDDGGLFVRKLDKVERLDGYVSTGVPVVISRFDRKSGATTPWRSLVPGEPGGHLHIDNVAITPDGRSYAYAYAVFSSVLYLADGLR